MKDISENLNNVIEIMEKTNKELWKIAMIPKEYFGEKEN